MHNSSTQSMWNYLSRYLFADLSINKSLNSESLIHTSHVGFTQSANRYVIEISTVTEKQWRIKIYWAVPFAAYGFPNNH